MCILHRTPRSGYGRTDKHYIFASEIISCTVYHINCANEFEKQVGVDAETIILIFDTWAT